MSYLTLDAVSNPATLPWRQETVQSFFAGFSWSGTQPHATPGQPTAAQLNTDAPLNATVSQFFESFPWEGQPTIGAPIAPMAAQQTATPTSSDLTLDDISSLFG